MKILSFILSGRRPLPDECNLTLREMNHDLEIITLHSQGGLIIIPNKLVNEIRTINPDIFFSVNYFDCVGKLSKILKIPYISWIGDNPHYYLKREDISEYLIIFLWEKTYVPEIKAKGFKSVYYLPLATNPKRFRELKLADGDLKKYSCNISFVGSSLYRYLEKYKEYREKQRPEVQEVLDKTIEIQLQNPTLGISNILNEVQEATSKSLIFNNGVDKLNTFLQLAAMARYRFEYVKEASVFGLHLWGDEGWLKWGSGGLNFKGGIDYRNLPKLYNASKINLNITVAQARSGLNQRPFDVSACGAFLLTDYRSELGNLFKLGEEIICYRDKEELKELVRYFFGHPEERQEIAQRAKMRVLRDHTFEKRISEMLEIVCSILSG